MRQAFLISVAAVCVLLSGCKRTHESVMKDTISCVKDATAVLKTVKDEASAKAAQPKMQKIGERMKKLRDEMEKMPKPTAAQDEQLKKKFDTELTKTMSDFAGEMMRISMDSKLAPALEGVEKSFGGASKK